MEIESLKCVCVGDGGVGKTCMMMSFSADKFPVQYVPTVFDNYHADFNVNGRDISLGLWDTAGQEEYDRLRPLSYPYTDVFLICYSATSPSSLENVKTKWLPEIRMHCPDIPYILVGTKSDIREDEQEQQRIIQKDLVCDFTDLQRVKAIAAELGASRVMECSAKTKAGLKDVFNVAVEVALSDREKRKANKKRKKCSLL